MSPIADLIQSTADLLFVPVLVVVLFGTGVFLTFRLGFVQVRRFRDALREFLGGRTRTAARGALTPFQAFMTALAATIGTGNIAGVAAGIAVGGPGMLFLTCSYAFFPTSTNFPNAVLELTYRHL